MREVAHALRMSARIGHTQPLRCTLARARCAGSCAAGPASPVQVGWEAAACVHARSAARAQGWVALSGLKFGADLVLYQGHPADVHADFCVIALPAEPRPEAGVGAGGARAGAGASPGTATEGAVPCGGIAPHGSDVCERSGDAGSVDGACSCAAPGGAGAARGDGAEASADGAGAAAGPRASASEDAGGAPARPSLGCRTLAWSDLEAANRLCTQVSKAPASPSCGASRLGWVAFIACTGVPARARTACGAAWQNAWR